MVDRLVALCWGTLCQWRATFQSGPLVRYHTLDGAEPFGSVAICCAAARRVWHGAARHTAWTGPTAAVLTSAPHGASLCDQTATRRRLCLRTTLPLRRPRAKSTGQCPATACVCIPLTSLPDACRCWTLLFAEGQANNWRSPGHRLEVGCRVLLVAVAAQLMRTAAPGWPAGQPFGARSQLRRAMCRMHQPGAGLVRLNRWQAVAGMSEPPVCLPNSSFAEGGGETPASYLQRWRVGWCKSG